MRFAAAALVDELEKLGAISPEEAEHAYNRLGDLERNKPTLGQAARYGGLGAVTGTAIGALGTSIAGGAKAVRGSGLRGAAAGAVTGALASGAVPLMRNQLDRKAEERTLKKFLKQDAQEPVGSLQPAVRSE